MFGEVLGTLDRRDHALHCQEGSEVGCVGGYDDEGKEPPDAPYDASGHSPGVDIGALLHEGAHCEPEGVRQGEAVVHNVFIGIARVWVVPLVGAKASQYKHEHADDKVGSDYVNPDLDGQRIKEREETGAFPLGPLEQDADTKVHERLSEVDDLLS